MLVVRGGRIECTDSNNEKITSRTKEDGTGGELITTQLQLQLLKPIANLPILVVVAVVMTML